MTPEEKLAKRKRTDMVRSVTQNPLFRIVLLPLTLIKLTVRGVRWLWKMA